MPPAPLGIQHPLLPLPSLPPLGPNSVMTPLPTHQDEGWRLEQWEGMPHWMLPDPGLEPSDSPPGSLLPGI